MIELVCKPLPVRIAQHGCHGNYAFSHSPNEFFLSETFFLIQGWGGGGGGAGNFLGTNEKLTWSAR